MRVLSHGVPFFCDETPLVRYQGPHEIRYLANFDKACYRYDPLAENAPAVIERIAKKWPPDLLLCWMPEVHPPPRGIEDVPVKTVALVSDWNVFHPILRLNLARYDLVLCDKPGVEALRSEWVEPHHLFPLYSQVSTFHRPYDIEKDLDVVFLGNLNHAAHTLRARYLERLARLSDRFRVIIAGGVFGEDYGRLLSRARIVFNHSIRGELNLRVFETFACGSLAFLEEGNLEAGDWFEDGRELVFYNEDNLEERLEHYLTHPEEAEAIAARGHARAAEFAGENRWDALIEWAAAQPGERAFHHLPATERLFQDFSMYAFSRWNVYHPIEEELVGRLAAEAPGDPRTWTALGQHFSNAYVAAGTPEQRAERQLKAFIKAHMLAPESAVYAFNVACIARACGDEARESHFLQASLEAGGLAGAESLVGNSGDAFHNRWQLAIATGAASPGMLHAEAHIRLAVILARNGRVDLAEQHLREARALDAANTGGVALLAEIEWVTDRRDDAVNTLREALPDMPLDVHPRQRLHDMLTELARYEEAEAVARDTERIASAFPTATS